MVTALGARPPPPQRTLRVSSYSVPCVGAVRELSGRDLGAAWEPLGSSLGAFWSCPKIEGVLCGKGQVVRIVEYFCGSQIEGLSCGKGHSLRIVEDLLASRFPWIGDSSVSSKRREHIGREWTSCNNLGRALWDARLQWFFATKKEVFQDLWDSQIEGLLRVGVSSTTRFCGVPHHTGHQTPASARKF